MEETDPSEDEKNDCPVCHNSLFVLGLIVGPERGEVLRCEDECCNYQERRLYD